MKRFLAVYMGTPATFEKWTKLDPATRKEREAAGMKAWMDWGMTNKPAIVDQGTPLGKTRRISLRGCRTRKTR